MSRISRPGIDTNWGHEPWTAKDSAVSVRQLRARADRANAAVHRKGHIERRLGGDVCVPAIDPATCAGEVDSATESVSDELFNERTRQDRLRGYVFGALPGGNFRDR